MTFVDIPFPDCIALGAESNPTWSTDITPVDSGRESANQKWADTRHEFDVSFAVRTKSDYLLVRSHFHQVRARAKSFPMKDFLDFEVDTTEGLLFDAAGVAPAGNGTFFLYKRYGSGADAYDRKITRPDNPVQVFRNGGDITGAGAAVTYTTGAVAITGHTGGDVYTWSGTFKVPCRYDTDRLPAAAINKQGSGDGGELLVDCGSIPIIEVREG